MGNYLKKKKHKILKKVKTKWKQNEKQSNDAVYNDYNDYNTKKKASFFSFSLFLDFFKKEQNRICFFL